MRLLAIGGGVLAIALVVGVIASVAYVGHIAEHTPNPCSERPLLTLGSSQVFASNGERLGFIHSEELRSPIGWGQIPQNLKNATVAIEDQRFYRNNGVDLTGIFRSAVKDVLHGQALQGGSTITMQLMRNLYMRTDTRTFKQKIQEAKMALDYAKCRSKHEVLTEYLNSVPYGTLGGQTAIGVQAAARVFFDKPASELNLEQSALLAGLPQAPSEYNPLLDPSAARQRRNEVLAKMAELHYISGAQASAAKHAPLETHAGNYYTQRREDFFFEYVHEQLVHRYGRQAVEKGGLKVYTTIDLNMQRLARKAIAEVLNEPEDPAAAVVTLNPANGDIEAMAESESYEQSQYNLAADGHRQPGSTFKAIDLADALSRGVDPSSTYYNSHTLEPGWLSGYPEYLVKTFGGEQNGTINLVQATLKSDNTVYAQLAADLGEETVTQMAYAMGVKTHLSSFPAEALGGLTLGVTPLEMAVVYATLADSGWRNTPIAITKVVFPDGHADESWGQPNRVKVLGAAITGEETRILHQNVLGGTATRSQINCPTAAKTGTTSELYDAWLDGYNSEYSTVVWMGYPKRNIAMTDVHGEPQQGGYLPAEIWHAYMAPVTEGHACAALHESNQGISFRPFYGKFATTGQGGGENQPGEESFAGPGPHPSPRPHKAPGPSAPPRAPAETPAESHKEAPAETPAPESHPAPTATPVPAGAPGANQTGGASP
jgi:penicillin-binding protein 1A